MLSPAPQSMASNASFNIFTSVYEDWWHTSIICLPSSESTWLACVTLASPLGNSRPADAQTQVTGALQGSRQGAEVRVFGRCSTRTGLTSFAGEDAHETKSLASRFGSSAT